MITALTNWDLLHFIYTVLPEFEGWIMDFYIPD